MPIIDGNFVSVFKINNTPILPPVITEDLRKQITEIREICRSKEEKLKQRKDSLNQAKKKEEEEGRCSSANSYVVSSPFFPVSELPEANEVSSDNRTESSDKETIIDGSLTIQSESLMADDESEKESKNAQNSFDKESTIFEKNEPEIKMQLRDLIDKQKNEYVTAMKHLKMKFLTEQNALLHQLQNQMHNHSTPMTNNSFIMTEDEEFAEFKSDLHSSSERTLTNESDIKSKAATKINALCRGYLTRRLMKTSCVQERVKNILDTLHYIRNIEKHHSGSKILRDDLLKQKLFMYLQGDLYRINDIFINYSTKEKMKIIRTDRESRLKRIMLRNEEMLNDTIQTI